MRKIDTVFQPAGPFRAGRRIASSAVAAIWVTACPLLAETAPATRLATQSKSIAPQGMQATPQLERLGRGQGGPSATVDPVSFSVAMDPDQMATETLAIGNVNGASELSWEVTTVETSNVGQAPVTAGSSKRGSPARFGTGNDDDSVRGDESWSDLSTAIGREVPSVRPSIPAGAVVDCENDPGIIIQDDGTVENGYGFNELATRAIFVDRYTPSSYPATFTAVCLAFLTLGPTSLDFEIVVFDDDGPENSPGTELGVLPVSASGVPGTPGEPVWFSYDISSLGLSINSGSVFIGARWGTPYFLVFLASDESPGNPPGFAGGYRWNDFSNEWTPIVSQPSFSDYRSLFVRPVEHGIDCDDPTDISWLSIDPSAGSTPAGDTSDVQVSFDTTGLVPGPYRASICLTSNDPIHPVLAIPVSLTVTIPPHYAVIEGTVEGLGYCGTDPNPASDAQVVIESEERVYTVFPNGDGVYQLALDPVEGPVNITASAPEHVAQVLAGVPLISGETVIRDFGLVAERPCAAVEPGKLTAQLPAGTSRVYELAVDNLDGGAPLEWTIRNGTSPVGGMVDCEERNIIIHDDGTIENGYSANPDVTSQVILADRFTPSAYPATFSTVCVAFITQGPTSLDFEIVVYDDTPDGGPGTELGALPLSASGIPSGTGQPVWFRYDISSLGITIGSGSVYIGVRWAPSRPNVYLASDQSSGNPVGFAEGYWWNDLINTWKPIESSYPHYRSIFVRAVEQELDCSDVTSAPWLSLDPASGSTPPGDSSTVQIAVDTSGLAQGDYVAHLCVESNDPLEPLIVVPVVLTVLEDVPIVDLSPDSLVFAVSVDSASTQILNLNNIGAADLVWNFDEAASEGVDGCAVPIDIPWLSTSPESGTTPVGDSATVDVTVDTSDLVEGEYTAQLCLTSNDPTASLVPVPVTLTVLPVNKAYTPAALVVDPEMRVSDGNGVFEPNELVDVAPSWRNDGEATQSVMGTASDFSGPPDAMYTLAAEDADYGSFDPGQVASCLDTELCYVMALDDPSARPATHWEATFEETLDDAEATSKTWTLHIGGSFVDIPASNPFYAFIETLLHAGVTGGCTSNEYCPTGGNTRAQMAVFLLKAAEGGDYAPPVCVEGEELFADVPFDSTFCPWIEELAGRGITSGCGGDNYCSGSQVTRAQMAVFLLKAFEGGGYTPPECTGGFTDVGCPSAFAAWIEELAARDITGGCGSDPPTYCPADPVTRQQMAVFVTKTFGVTLYGP